MGVVRQLSDYQKPRLEAVEQRVADTDDGYTRIANELLEAVMSADLTARQLKVALAIIRKTYGFGKKVDRITNTQIASMTGIHHTHVCTAKNEMIAMNIVIASGSQIGINKVVSDWKFNISQDSKTLAKSANKSLANAANEHSPTQLNTKETIQKKKENTPNPLTEVGAECVKPTRRKPVRVNYEEYLDAYNEIVGDRLPHAVEANAERQRKLRKLIESLATKNVDGFRAYVKAFMASARPFHFGDNDREWVATFDYLLRPKVLTAIREGTL
ncbi:TPA: replication protein [Serratia odorifera]|nr:replication protein [Serratia odorifera]